MKEGEFVAVATDSLFLCKNIRESPLIVFHIPQRYPSNTE